MKLSSILCLVLSVSAVDTAAAVSLDDYETAAMGTAGDVERGRQVFNDAARAKCATCHRVDGAGGEIGPDLSSIGGKFDRIHLIESILHPAAQIVEGYQTTSVLLFDGSVAGGMIRNETEDAFDLVGTDGKATRIERDDVAGTRLTTTSIMPDGLAAALSVDEFTDLIAYLESCRAGMETGWGADTAGPMAVAEGLSMRPVVTGLDAAVAMETTPDGRVLICEQRGRLRVVKDDRLLDEPMLEIDVEDNWERGLIGVTLHPDFPRENWVYVCYVTDRPYSHHVVSRFRVEGDVADPASEEILLEGDDQESFGGFKKSGHQGGGIHFGPDGCLYVGLGEQTARTPSQDLGMLQGKILRLNADGGIPTDNPFVERTTGKYRSIWAMGLRNPFTMAFRDDGLLFINDVGGAFEEINVGRAGANYGWPVADHGPSDDPAFASPIHYYPESSINGGDFAPDTAPASLRGKYVFGDYVRGWVRTLDPADLSGTGDGHAGPVESLPTGDVAAGLRRLVDLRFTPAGDLYVLLRNAWILDDKLPAETGSLLKISGR